MQLHPPKLARWLLSHFGCSPNNEAVIGDLDERYRIGCSRIRYWKQVTFTIMVSFLKEISDHKLRAVTAITIGWAALYAYSLLLRPPLFYLWADEFVGLSANGVVVAVNLVRLLIVLTGGEISGRAVRYSSGAHWRPIVLGYAISVLMVSTWIAVDILQRPHMEAFLGPVAAAATLVWLVSVLHGGNILARSSQATHPA